MGNEQPPLPHFELGLMYAGGDSCPGKGARCGEMKMDEYRVLLVDDDEAMLCLLTRWLKKAGYLVRTARNGREALEAIELECPDFLISDWAMPELDGMELCRQVRSLLLPHYVYVLILTVKNDATEMITALDHGADDFLSKPITEAQLLARMRSSRRMLELERRLSAMAHADSLTGLLTQRTFYEALDKEWHRTRRSSAPLSAVMLDLDFFKQINDVYGHPAGDSVLKLVAELLLDNCRASDTVCRYGGEEFAVMLPETSEANAIIWAERVRAKLAALHVPERFKDLSITGSFGVAETSEDLRSCEELVDLADQSLLCAKRMGRDRVVAYSSLVQTAGMAPRGELAETASSVLARDIMQPLQSCLDENDSIAKAVDLVLDGSAAFAPVLKTDGMLAGYVSEKDLLGAIVSLGRWQQPVSSVVRSKVICYDEATRIEVIYEFLCRVSVRGVVITRNGRPVGTIDSGSLLRWYREPLGGPKGCGWATQAGLGEGSRPDRAFEPSPHSLDSACECPAGA